LVGASLLGVAIIAVSFFSKMEAGKPAISESQEEESGILVINGGASTSVTDIISKDSDKDGLKDWEEALYGTDPQNPDTNGNGTSDEAEVRPKNTLKNKAYTTSSSVNSPVATTTTDQFGQQFFVAVSALKNAGTVDPESIKNTAESIYSGVKYENIKPLYSIGDIVVIENPTNEQILAYGKNLGLIIEKYGKYNLGQELPVISKALEIGDKTLPLKLAPYITAYTNIAKDTSLIAIPEKIASLHLDLLNAYHGTAQSLKIAGKIFEDPLLAMQGINQYLFYSNKIVDIATTLEVYFKSGVILNNIKP
jgi:hypothetical protein